MCGVRGGGGGGAESRALWRTLSAASDLADALAAAARGAKCQVWRPADSPVRVPRAAPQSASLAACESASSRNTHPSGTAFACTFQDARRSG